MSCGTGGRALGAAHALTGLADSHRCSGRLHIDTYSHVLSGMAGGWRKRWTSPTLTPISVASLPKLPDSSLGASHFLPFSRTLPSGGTRIRIVDSMSFSQSKGVSRRCSMLPVRLKQVNLLLMFARRFYA
jgi:hypothetical protein